MPAKVDDATAEEQRELTQAGAPGTSEQLPAVLPCGLVLVGSPDDALAHIHGPSDEADLDYFVGAVAWGDLAHAETMASLDLFIDAVVRPSMNGQSINPKTRRNRPWPSPTRPS